MSLPNVNKKNLRNSRVERTNHTLFQTKTAKKPIPFGAAQTNMANIKGVVRSTVACNNALSNNNISLKNLLGLEIIKSLLEFLNFIFMHCQCNVSDSLYDTRMTLVPG